MYHEEIEQNINVEDVEEIGQEGELHAGNTRVPPIYKVLAQQNISFLKGLVGDGVPPTFQETKAPANPPIAFIVPKVGGNVGNKTFLLPFVGSVMIGNEHEILTKFVKLKLPMFHDSDNKDP